jgi:NOL1/NOP2/fmu family ribosome biogenesis protein
VDIGELAMAEYQVTIEILVTLSQKVTVASIEEAEQQAEAMYQGWKQGQTAHVAGTERHQSVELSGSQTRRWRFAPA